MEFADRASESPLQFPCRFPVKVVGKADCDLRTLVQETIQPHAPELDATDLATRTSRNGRYLSVTATLTAHSREQLDAVYEALTAREECLWVL